MSPLIDPSCRDLSFSSDSYFGVSCMSKINYVWLELNFFLVFKIPIFYIQMSRTQLGPNDPVCRFGSFEKTGITISLAVYPAVFFTTQTLIIHKPSSNMFIDYSVEMSRLIVLCQEILDLISDFCLHFLQHPFKYHNSILFF